MAKILLVFLLFGTSSSAYSQRDEIYFSYGRINDEGFIFIGNPAIFSQQCIHYMQFYNVRRVSSLVLATESQEVIEPMPAMACQYIFNTAIKVGRNRDQIRVQGLVDDASFILLGQRAQVIDECRKNILSNNRKYTTKNIYINDRKVELKNQLKGDQLCGFLLSKSSIVRGIFVQYYVSGQINNRGFIFYGLRDRILASCKRFIDDINISIPNYFYIGTAKIPNENKVDGYGLCNEILEYATPVSNIRDRYEVSGKINNQGYWFTGNRIELAASCDKFIRQNSLQARLIRTLETAGYEINLTNGLRGPAICDFILTMAKNVSAPDQFRYAAGKLTGKGFLFYGNMKNFSDQCKQFLNRFNISSANRVAFRGPSYRDPVLTANFSETERDEFICQRLFAGSYELSDQFRNASWHLAGSILDINYQFNGTLLDIFSQCEQFIATNNLQFKHITSIREEHVNYHLSRPAQGSEACISLLSLRPPEDLSSLVLVAGSIDNYGFSFAMNRLNFTFACSTELENIGINMAQSYRIFDTWQQPPGPIMGAANICRRFLEDAIELEQWPDVNVTSSFNGIEFNFTGKLNAANERCRSIIEDTPIANVTTITISGETYQAPNGRWNGYEVCGFILQKYIDR